MAYKRLSWLFVAFLVVVVTVSFTVEHVEAVGVGHEAGSPGASKKAYHLGAWAHFKRKVHTWNTWVKSKYDNFRGTKRVPEKEVKKDVEKPVEERVTPASLRSLDGLSQASNAAARRMLVMASTPHKVLPWKQWLNGADSSQHFSAWRGWIESNMDNCVDFEIRIKSIDFRALYKATRKHKPDVDFSQPTIFCSPATYSTSDISRLGRCMTDWGTSNPVTNWHKGKWTHKGEMATWDPPLKIPIKSPYGRNAVQCDIRFGWDPRTAASFRIFPFYMKQAPEGDEDYFQEFSALSSPYFGVAKSWKEDFPASLRKNARGPAVKVLKYNSCGWIDDKRCAVTAQYRCNKVIELQRKFDPKGESLTSREFKARNQKLMGFYGWAVENKKKPEGERDAAYPGLGPAKSWKRESGACPNVISHRAVFGVSDRENRADGLDDLWADGIAGIEIDVFLEGRGGSNGHRVTVIHDDDFGRLLGIDSIKVTEFTSPVQLDGLKKATGCIWQFDNLNHYIAKAKKLGLLVNIELKPGNPMSDPFDEYAAAIGRSVGTIVRHHNYEHNTVVSSFDVNKIAGVNQGAPAGRRIRVIRQTFNSALSQFKSTVDNWLNNDIKYEGHAYHYSLLTKEIVDEEHGAGRLVGVYTIFDRYDRAAHNVELIDKLIQWGVDWMETDNPQLLQRYMRMSPCSNNKKE